MMPASSQASRALSTPSFTVVSSAFDGSEFSVFAKAVASPEFEKRMTETGNTMLYLPTDEFEALWDKSHNRLEPALETLQKQKQG